MHMAVVGRVPSIEKALADGPSGPPPQVGIENSVSRPADLPAEAVPMWDLLVSDLDATGVFRPADAPLLEELVCILVEAKDIRKRMAFPQGTGWIAGESKLSSDEREELRHNEELRRELWPASAGLRRLRTAYKQHMDMVLRIASEFGLSPVARLRLGILQLQGASLTDLFGDDNDDAPPPLQIEAYTDAEVI